MTGELGITWAPGEDSQAMNSQGLPAIHATAGESFRNELEDFTVTGSLWRFMARQAYQLRGDVQWMDADLATKRYGIPGKLEFDEPVPEPTARQLWETNKRELAIDAIRARGNSPFAQAGGALVAQILDPLNIAAAYVPVVGEARYAEMLAKAGGAFGRAALRASTGAASGVVGTAPLELLHMPLAQLEGRHYTADEAMLNVVFGGALGGGLHVVGGSVADLFRGSRRALSDFQRRMDALPPDRKGQALQAGIGDLLDGGYVRNAHTAIDGGEPQPWRPHPADQASFEMQIARTGQGEVPTAPTGPDLPPTPPRQIGEPIHSFRTVDGRLYDVDELGGATSWWMDPAGPYSQKASRTLYVPETIAQRLEQAPLAVDRQRAFTVSIRGDEARLIELETGPRGGWNVVGTHAASARPAIGLRPMSLDQALSDATVGKRLTSLWSTLHFGERIGEINPADRMVAAGVQAPAPAAPIAGTAEGAIDSGLVQRLRSSIGDRRQPLTVEQLSSRLEAAPADVRRALGHLAAMGEIRLRTDRTGGAVFSRLPQRGPLDVLDFIAARGGLKDDAGELAARDAQRMTAYGPLVRDAGRGADAMGEALHEAGYFPSGKESWTEADVYDLVDRALRGEKIYSEADAADLAQHQARLDQRDANRAYLQADKDIRRIHDELGGDLERSELARLSRYAVDHELDLEDVLSHALERKAMAMLDSDRQGFGLPDDVASLYRSADEVPPARSAAPETVLTGNFEQALETAKATRATHGLRADVPSVSPRGGRFFSVMRDAEGNAVGTFEGTLTPTTLRIRGSHLNHDVVAGQGVGGQAYRDLIDWALASGRTVQSDKIVLEDAARVYGSLEREGYRVRRNPKAETNTETWDNRPQTIAPNDEPVFEILSGPRPVDEPPASVHDPFDITEIALGPDASNPGELAVTFRTRARPPGGGEPAAPARQRPGAAGGREGGPSADGGHDGSARAAPGAAEQHGPVANQPVSAELKDLAAALELAERQHAAHVAAGRIKPADAAAIADADTIIATARRDAIAREAAVFCPEA